MMKKMDWVAIVVDDNDLWRMSFDEIGWEEKFGGSLREERRDSCVLLPFSF